MEHISYSAFLAVVRGFNDSKATFSETIILNMLDAEGELLPDAKDWVKSIVSGFKADIEAQRTVRDQCKAVATQKAADVSKETKANVIEFYNMSASGRDKPATTLTKAVKEFAAVYGDIANKNLSAWNEWDTARRMFAHVAPTTGYNVKVDLRKVDNLELVEWKPKASPSAHHKSPKDEPAKEVEVRVVKGESVEDSDVAPLDVNELLVEIAEKDAEIGRLQKALNEAHKRIEALEAENDDLRLATKPAGKSKTA